MVCFLLGYFGHSFHHFHLVVNQFERLRGWKRIMCTVRLMIQRGWTEKRKRDTILDNKYVFFIFSHHFPSHQYLKATVIVYGNSTELIEHKIVISVVSNSIHDTALYCELKKKTANNLIFYLIHAWPIALAWFLVWHEWASAKPPRTKTISFDNKYVWIIIIFIVVHNVFLSTIYRHFIMTSMQFKPHSLYYSYYSP